MNWDGRVAWCLEDGWAVSDAGDRVQGWTADVGKSLSKLSKS